MKYYRILIVLLIIISCLTLSSCDTVNFTDDILVGDYASSTMEDSIDNYAQFNCTFTTIDYSKYSNSNENVLQKYNAIIPTYFEIELYIKTNEMNSYSRVNIIDLSSGLNSRGNVEYTGKAYYIYQDIKYESDIVIGLFYDSHFLLEAFDYSEYLTYQTRTLNTDETIFSNRISRYTDGWFHSAKIVLKEINEDEFGYGNKNQFQALYGNQYLEIEFYVKDNETLEFIRIDLYFDHYSHAVCSCHESYFYGTAYIPENNENVEYNFYLSIYDTEEISLELINEYDFFTIYFNGNLND